MIPRTAREADDLLRCRLREVATTERQVEHFGVLQQNARERLARLQEEVGAIRRLYATPPAFRDLLLSIAASEGCGDSEEVSRG